MRILSVTEVARNFSAVIDRVEGSQEEIVLKRNHKTIARLVPETPAQNALDVLGDLYRTLDDKTANALVKSIGRANKGRGKTIKALRNPWES